MNELTCECRICKEHRFEVKDRHPEIKWKLSRSQKMDEIRSTMKAYSIEMDKAKKMLGYN